MPSVKSTGTSRTTPPAFTSGVKKRFPFFPLSYSCPLWRKSTTLVIKRHPIPRGLNTASMACSPMVKIAQALSQPRPTTPGSITTTMWRSGLSPRNALISKERANVNSNKLLEEFATDSSLRKPLFKLWPSLSRVNRLRR